MVSKKVQLAKDWDWQRVLLAKVCGWHRQKSVVGKRLWLAKDCSWQNMQLTREFAVGKRMRLANKCSWQKIGVGKGCCWQKCAVGVGENLWLAKDCS